MDFDKGEVTVTKQYNNMTTIFGEQAAAQSLG